MTREELTQLVKHNLKNSPMIDTEIGLKAIAKIAQIAAKENVEWALAGGLAMHIYGSPRLTKDVDLIASAVLSIEPERQLGFGGERYTVRVGKKDVPVDWIVRRDLFAVYYRAALSDADEIGGVKIITPEWLVITKYIAGRFKDQEDAVFLLRQPELVERQKIKANYLKIGEAAWSGAAPGLSRWFDIADFKVTDGDENESYRKL